MDFKKVYRKKYDENYIEKMYKAKVGIAGLGGLGSNIALMLMRAGVRNFTIADFDRVEPTNLNRQNYHQQHIGQKKTEATEKVLKQIDEDVTIKKSDEYLTEENIRDVFKDVDIIIEAFDNPESKATLVNYALKHFKDKYIIAHSGIGGHLSSNNIKTRRLKDRFYLVGDQVADGNIYPMMSPRVMIAASHSANMALRLIQGKQEV